MKKSGRKHRLRAAMLALIAMGLAMPAMVAVQESRAAGMAPLNTVPVPLPPNLAEFVADNEAAIRLGKALFWDMQAGGDGIQACASCHFQAGEDNRLKNTVNPGVNGTFEAAGPGERLHRRDDFPLNTGDIVGSQGITKRTFNGLSGGPIDDCTEVPDAVFNKDGVNVRQVTGRNAPTVINSVFNFRSFWDGRAHNVFNGVNPNGPDDPAQVLQVVDGLVSPVSIQIPNASLASQATGPPMSDVEMTCAGREFRDIGRKLLNLRPLRRQLVAKTDSVLGGRLSRSPNNGLRTTYGAMIQEAFQPRWWDSDQLVDGYTVMENNFTLYWGLSIMMYEATLVSDDTPVDRYLAGDLTALTPLEISGMDVFTGEGRCDQCHGRAETTEATVSQTDPANPTDGFDNIGVALTAEDGGDILQPGEGKFKTPGLRNIELRGPFFHNGSAANLRQVVEFYNRGGNFSDGFTDSQIRQLNLTDLQKRNLVRFLMALTDERVRFERAPFDHPSLIIGNGANLPAIGAEGRDEPLMPFANLNQFVP
jgi:cytochrome c peroxidase